MGSGSRLVGIALFAGLLAAVPLLVARPTVPPPPVTRPAIDPTRLDLDGNPLAAGAIARAGTLRFRHGGEIGGVVFSPVGPTVYTASGFAMSSPPAKGVKAWDIATGRQRRAFGDDAPFCAIDVSPDGKLVAAGDEDRGIRIWDAATGREVRRITPFEDHRAGRGEANPVWFVHFSRDGKHVAALAGYELVVLDVATGREKARHSAGEGGVFSTNCYAGRLATIVHGTVRVIDLSTGDDVATVKLETDPDPTLAITLSPDGNTVVTSTQKQTVRAWNLADGKLRWQAVLPGDLALLAYSPAGEVLAVASTGRADAGSVMLLDATTGKERGQFEDFSEPVYAIRFSPDGKTLATGGRGQTLRLWDTVAGKERPTFEAHPGPVTTIAVSGDGRILASCSEQDRIARLWDTSTGRQIRGFAGHDGGVEEVTITPDGKLIASAAGNVVCLWDAESGRLIHKLEEHVALGPYLRFSEDGKTLATGGRGNLLALWNCSTGKVIREFPAPPRGVAAFLTFRDGRLLVFETPNNDEDGDVPIEIWDATANRLVRRFVGHASGGRPSIGLSPDGRMLASRSADKTIRVWEMASGNERGRFDEPGELRYTGEWTGTQFLAFSPDGRTLVTGGSDDPLARRWDLGSGKELQPLTGHRSWVGAIEYSADGRVLATGSQDTTAIFWDGPRASAPVLARLELTEGELAERWEELKDSDAAKAFHAIKTLGRGGDRSARWLAAKVRPVANADPVALTRWLEDLDDVQFTVRERAAAALTRVADQAEDSLRGVLERTRSAEVRQRIRGILEVAQDVEPSPDRLREIRAVEALELTRAPAAREHLARLAGGAPRANLTREAKAALRRLDLNGSDIR
jgi:WD40 repeat protein